MPGTKHGCVPKVLEATDFKAAITEFIEFKEHLKNNGYQKIEIKQDVFIPTRLVECFAYYMGYLNNVDVPKHKQKNRTPAYISKFDLLLEQYQDALEMNGINSKILKFTEVNDQMVGYVHDYFLETLNLANKTYNNNMALLSAFTSHVIIKFKFDYTNPFLGVPDRVVNIKTESVKENEFERLLELVTLENGVVWEKVSTLKNPKKRTVYRPWLKSAYKFGLFTGGRSEDIVEPKWSDIILTEKGEFDTIKVVDHKIDSANSHRTSKGERFYKHFAITKELAALLIEMGYEQYKGTDKYIVATEELKMNRAHVAVLISKSFTHYYRQLNTGKQVSFKHLRKAFMTSALIEFGSASPALTNHATVNMTNKHYHDKSVTRDQAKESFSVFKNGGGKQK
ncbi:MAG: hypothetical protein ACXVP0_06440 [Bacteroidia bacterium]